MISVDFCGDRPCKMQAQAACCTIHDFDIKATLCAMPAYVIFAENGGRRGMIYANIDRFPIDGDTAVMIP